MADITWDTTLPQFVNTTGYTEQEQIAKLESAMDTGPAYMRSLYTAVPIKFSITLTLTNAQVDTLRYFYKVTCKNGTLAFNWVHPRKPEEAVVMRFIGKAPSFKTKAYNAYITTFIVEVLP